MNCWDYMDCPKEVRAECPAHPKNGRDCWKMPSTMCAGGRYRLATLLDKIAFCRKCEFYKLHANRPADAGMADGPLAARPQEPE